MSHRLYHCGLIISNEGVAPNSLTKDPKSAFIPVGIRKGCVEYGHHVIYNSVLSQLGLLNEVQRPDRDEYIEVNTYVIGDDFKPHFQKHSDWSRTNKGYPFDIGSIMMFDSYDFTKYRDVPILTTRKADTHQLFCSH